MYIKRDAAGKWPHDQMAYIQRLKGNFTVVLKPSNEFFYISSNTGNAYNGLFNGGEPAATDQNILDLVNRITALEAEKISLLHQVENLTQELKQFETASDKFTYALENLFFKIAPKLGLMPEPVLNGTQTNTHNMEAWQNIKIDHSSERGVEQALEVIYMAFGDEFLMKFAQRIQDQPQLVQQLKAMI